MPAPDRVVHLHVGTPKSGTTYLQRVLASNRDRLARSGYLYPGRRQAHFMAALDVRDRGFRGHRYAASKGAWAELVSQVLEFDGPALVSHEILGSAAPDEIGRAVDSFADRPVRVVVTCRDLGRQVPATWQERVKNRHPQTYDEFLDSILAPPSERVPAPGERPAGSGQFWRSQDLADLGRRWGAAVGPGNVSFVTVPRHGAAPDELWHRFADAVGLPPFDRVDPGRGHNTSLGTAETELLRRLSATLPEDLPWPAYARLVKQRFAQRELVGHAVAGRLTVPEEWRPDVEEAAGRVVAELREREYRVVGDLADLQPVFRQDGTLPRDVTEAELLELSLRLMGPLVLREPAHQGAGRGEPSGRRALRELAVVARRRLRDLRR